MTATGTTTATRAGRRVGYGFAVAINVALLVATNVWPGWRVLPFLTEDFPQALELLNLGFVAGVVANVLYLVADRPRVRATGDLVTTAISLAAVVRLLQVFPFAFPTAGFDWALLVRVLLVLGVVGTAIALLVAFGSLVRLVARPGRP